jgi:hypothetical protein
MRLAPDWHDAGARSVLSYTQLNINFFYPQLFIDVFREAGGDVELAKSRTDEAIDGFLKTSKLHRTLVSLVQKGKTMEEYLAETENPKLSVVSK